MPQLMVGFPALINHSESEERLQKQLEKDALHADETWSGSCLDSSPVYLSGRAEMFLPESMTAFVKALNQDHQLCTCVFTF